MVLYGYKCTKLYKDDDMDSLAKFVRLSVSRFRKGKLIGSKELVQAISDLVIKLDRLDAAVLKQ
jgi:hypothetical protein